MVLEIVKNDNRPNTASQTYGYPVHKYLIAKENLRKPNNWTLLSEWEILSEREAIEAQFNGKDVIWSLVDKNKFELCVIEFDSKKYVNSNRKPTDSEGRRTIDDSLIEYCDTVLFDFDNTSFNETPQEVIDNAWLMCPSASQTGPTPDGDVMKMHYIHKMPKRIPRVYAKAYREIYLKELCGNLKYDIACVDPRREFYGVNPNFKDQKFCKVTLQNLIPLEVHTRILLQARDQVDNRVVKDVGSDNLIGKVDEHLLANASLGEICQSLFDAQQWTQKGSSTKCYDQWESVFPLHIDAKNPTAFSIEHSCVSGRILAHYKGDNELNYSLYELYTRYKRYLKGETQAESKDVSQDLKEGKFFKLVDEITEKLGIAKYPRDKKVNKKDKKSGDGGKKGTVKDYRTVFDEINNEHIRFCICGNVYAIIAYTEKNGTWSYASSDRFCEDILLEMMEVFNEKCEELDIPTIGKVGDFTTRLMNYHRVERKLYKSMPSFVSDWIGLKECDYNRFTNEIAPFNPNHNVWLRWDISLDEIDNSLDVKNRCLKGFEYMTDSKIGAELLWYYKAAEYLGLGKKVWQCLVISGFSRTGKSAYCQSSTALAEFAEAKKTPHVMLSKKELESPFALEQIDANTASLHFPEFNVTSRNDVDFVLSKIDSAKGININGKNKPMIQIPRNFMIYMSIQDDVVFPADNDGIKVRLQPVKLTLPKYAGMPMPQGQMYKENVSWHQEINDLFYDPEIQKQIFLYVLLHEKSSDVVKKLNELSNSPYAIEQRQLAISSNTVLTPAFEEFDIEVTGNEEDSIPSADLKGMLRVALKKEEYKNLSTKFIERLLVNHLEAKHPNEWEKIKTYRNKGETIDHVRRVDGKVLRVVSGIRFRDKSRQESKTTI